jgi:ferredoxin
VRAVVDKSLCVGHALCNLAAPEIYPLADDGSVLAELASSTRAGAAGPDRDDGLPGAGDHP